jgi:hypothetical protein
MMKYVLLSAGLYLMACRSPMGAASTPGVAYTIRDQQAKTTCNPKAASQATAALKYRLLLGKQLDAVAATADTVFLIEAFDLEFGRFYNAVLTPKTRLEYISYGDTVEVKTALFEPKLYDLVTSWDVKTIKQYESQYKLSHGGKPMAIFRLPLKKTGKPSCFLFKEFNIY